tara:strand:+ start:509 stop:1567 length:1059 start_codon:yes stop_codon:yes gene_type:complete
MKLKIIIIINMLPISAIVGVSTIGYLLDKSFKENYEKMPLENIISEFNNEIESQNDDKLSYSMDSELISVPDIQTVKVPDIQTVKVPDIKVEKQMSPFMLKTMVPFFSGSGTGQDMRGTGVPESNYNSDNYNLGNDNETPYNTRLSIFTGTDDTYRNKKELKPLFSPSEQKDKETIPGNRADSKRPLKNRYTTSLLIKNNEAPMPKINVGPGLNIDKNLPNDRGGFNSGLTTNIRLSNVDAYKLTQLPGRVAGEKYQVSNLPTALPGIGSSFKSELASKNNMNVNDKNGKDNDSIYGIKSNNKAQFYTLENRPLMATGANIQAQMHYSDIILPAGTDKKENTNISFGKSVKF